MTQPNCADSYSRPADHLVDCMSGIFFSGSCMVTCVEIIITANKICNKKQNYKLIEIEGW